MIITNIVIVIVVVIIIVMIKILITTITITCFRKNHWQGIIKWVNPRICNKGLALNLHYT